jgi:hypothetical protein
MTWSMPHEGETHERTWWAWPGLAGGYTLGDNPASAQKARTPGATVTHAALAVESVVVVLVCDAAVVVRDAGAGASTAASTVVSAFPFAFAFTFASTPSYPVVRTTTPTGAAL